jgi:hypothetical protein
MIQAEKIQRNPLYMTMTSGFSLPSFKYATIISALHFMLTFFLTDWFILLLIIFSSFTFCYMPSKVMQLWQLWLHIERHAYTINGSWKAAYTI